LYLSKKYRISAIKPESFAIQQSKLVE